MFTNRQEAGQKLIQKLLADRTNKELNNAVVLGVPRGGMIVAVEVAKGLKCQLDVIVTRKIGAPGNQELAVGAVGETEGSKYLNQNLIKDLGVSVEYLGQEIENQQREIKRREKIYRQGRSALDLNNKTAIIVDDGAATGATLIAACREVWNNHPKRVMIALPVAPEETVKKLEEEADEVEVLETPEPFFSVGQFYREFGQVEDEEVIKILRN